MMRALWAVALLSATIVSAQESQVRSPRTSIFELKLGTFSPDLDNSAAGAALKNVLGGGTSMLLGELHYERELFQKFGVASLGGSLGYAERYGHALDDAGVPTAVPSGLVAMPLKITAVYRFDYFAVRNNIPLVPYGKASLVFLHWWLTKGTTTEMSGWKRGFALTAGLAFMLDVLEPSLATEFDADIGVNHTYFFAEFDFSRVNNFGQPGFDFSDTHFMFGLAFEF
jgi:hypothetical protein